MLMTYRITATFFDEKDGSEKTVQVTVGESMMEAAHANDVDLEGEAGLLLAAMHLGSIINL